MTSRSSNGFIISTILLVIFIAAVVLTLIAISRDLEATCQRRFGPGWHGRTAAYSLDICTNSNGDVKYP